MPDNVIQTTTVPIKAKSNIDGTYDISVYNEALDNVYDSANKNLKILGKTGYTLVKATTSFTRPADTIAYTVGDAVTNNTTVPTVFEINLGALGAINGQAVEIRKIAATSNAKQSTLPFFNVYLSPTTFTATNDNDVLDIDDTTMEAGGAWVSLDEQYYTDRNARISKTNANIPMVLAADDTKIYGTLQAANAYTPVSGEKFTITLWAALL